MKNIKILVILALSSALSLTLQASEAASDVTEIASGLNGEYGTGKYADYFKEREKKSPFRPSPTKEGVCLLGGVTEYRFSDCAGLDGAALHDCCVSKDKTNVTVSSNLGFGTTPSWMKNNNFLSQYAK